MKIFLFLCICIGFTFTSNGQTEDKKWNIGIHGGITQYNGDLGRDWYETNNTMYAFGGISVSRYLWKYLDANLLLSKGTIGFHDGKGSRFKSDFNAVNLNLRFNPLSSEYIVRPYLFAGVGAILFDNELNFHQENYDYILPSAGGGINFRLTPSLMLNLQESFLFSNKDRRDGVDNADGNLNKKDSYLTHMAGLTFNFGDCKDEDKDGVSDKNDMCHGTPLNFPVDKNGCPLDKDGDGVADDKDLCPDIAGVSTLNGCPDSDRDGVADKDDRCANTKEGTQVDSKGCPFDSDNDGVIDDQDRCPNVAGITSLKGCPDTDGDGIPDIDDRCPSAKGNEDNKGCPEIAKADIVRITYIGSKIFFENNSDKLKVASLSLLDELSKILEKYSEAKLTIEGHTDNVGKDEYNMVLSQKRAESVKNYLIQKGVSVSRLTSLGYGETKPLTTNNTTLGKSKNRRVELKMNY